MKITAVILLAFCLHVSATSLAQNITLSERKAPLEKVLNEIKQQSGYLFFYNQDWMKQSQPVDIQVKNMPLEQVLKACFSNQPYTYEVVDKTIVLKLKEKPIEKKEEAVAADIFVNGLVTDEKGQPVAGANVKIKDTKKSTMTDASGRFELKDVDEKAVLQISYIGYATKELAVTKNFMLINLSIAVSKLDEVQVIAYGRTTERLSTGNVTTIKASDLAKSPSPNVLQALEGLVPGLYITQVGSNASSSYNIKLRGDRSILPNANLATTAGVTDAINTPLIVIDGFPLSTGVTTNNLRGLLLNTLGPAQGQSPLFSLNPNDIESISVLKDADATALYGSMGANGVILITTKKPKNGKIATSASVNYGFTQLAGKLKLLNTQQYLTMRREAFKNDALLYISTTTPTIANAYDLMVWDTTRYTDWQKELLGSKPSVTANVSIGGGQGNTTFRLSAGYFKNLAGYPGVPNDVVKNYAEDRQTIDLNTSSQSMNGRFKIATNVGFSSASSNLPNSSLESLIYLAPNAPALFTPEGNINWADWRIASGVGQTLGGLLNPYTSNTKDLTLGANLSYQLAKNLLISLRSSYHTTGLHKISVSTSRASTDPLLSPARQASFGEINFSSLSIEPTLNYTKMIGHHRLQFLAGANYNDNNNMSQEINAYGWLSDALMTSLSGASSLTGSSTRSETKIASVFAGINYNFEDKYILNLNGRRDGSSNFGPGNKYGNFGSVGAAWIFTQEKWLQALTKNSIFSFGKLRGSYGIMGTPLAAPYTYLSTYTSLGQTYAYQGTPIYQISRPANPNVQWSQTLKEELGFDLGFFTDRLLLSGAAYRDYTTDQITFSPLAATTGFTNSYVNLPAKVQNTGLEATVRYNSNPMQKLTWSVAANIGHNRNKLLSFPNLEQSLYRNIYKVGESINRGTAYPATVMDPQTGVYPAPITATAYLYDVAPSFTGGMQTQINYKGFTISANFTFAKQKGFEGFKVSGTPGSMISGLGNQITDVLARWQKPGDITVIPRFTTYSNQILDGYQNQAFFVDVSYIALKNATLSYNLSQKLLQRMGISVLSVNIMADNLFTISNYKGSNPEQPSSTVGLIRRNLSFGLNLSF